MFLQLTVARGDGFPVQLGNGEGVYTQHITVLLLKKSNAPAGGYSNIL